MSQGSCLRCASGDPLRIAVLLLIAMFACAATAAAGQVEPPEPVAAPPGTYVKDSITTCLRECHDTAPVNLVLRTPHAVKADSRTPFAQHVCETCHDPSPEHVAETSNVVGISYKGPTKSPVAVRNARCLTCHETGMREHWAGSQHEARGVACNDCHVIHATDQAVLHKATQADVCFTCHKEQRAEVRRISTHALAVTGLGSPAKMVCSDCHSAHGSTGPTLLIKNTVNETCYTCHAEKRGPFLWEHSPVVDSCVNCHTPHGSTAAPLLKARAPFLCQECHSGDHGAAINSGANLAAGNVTTINSLQRPGAAAPKAQMGARACMNCHVLVHGSNHPAGAKFQR